MINSCVSLLPIWLEMLSSSPPKKKIYTFTSAQRISRSKMNESEWIQKRYDLCGTDFINPTLLENMDQDTDSDSRLHERSSKKCMVGAYPCRAKNDLEQHLLSLSLLKIKKKRARIFPHTLLENLLDRADGCLQKKVIAIRLLAHTEPALP